MYLTTDLRNNSVHSDSRRLSRRIGLFLGIMLSGGVLVLPRIPMLLLFFLFLFAASGWRVVPLGRTNKIWLILLVIMLVSIFRPGPLDIDILIIRYANFLAGLFLLATYMQFGYPVLWKDMFVLMPWMAIQAVVTFVLANFAPWLFTYVELPDESSLNTFLLVFNYHVLNEGYSGWQRPDGFFWEPGVFQLYLNLYLYLGLFVFRNRNHVLLALAALFCVYSTTGVLVTSLVLSAALFNYLLSTNTRHRLLIFLAAILIFPAVGYLAAKNIEEKFGGELRGSSMIRQYDLLVGLSIVSDYPMVGIGFNHERYLEIAPKFTSAQDRLGLTEAPERSNSNGIIYLAYSLGIPLASLFLWGIFRQKVFPNPWLVGAILFISILGEALIFTPFVLMFIFSAFVKPRAHGTVPGQLNTGIAAT